MVLLNEREPHQYKFVKTSMTFLKCITELLFYSYIAFNKPTLLVTFLSNQPNPEYCLVEQTKNYGKSKSSNHVIM